MSAETERLIDDSGVAPEAAEALRMGREWVEGLRAESEREGVLIGEPEEELQSSYYSVGEGRAMELLPGFAFWRTSENTIDGSSSRPYQTAKPMGITSYRFRRDSKGEIWVHLRSPVDEKSTFEKAHIRISRLEAGEHGIAIGNIMQTGE